MTDTISIELTPQEKQFFDGYNIALRHNPAHDPDEVQKHLDTILRRSFNALPKDLDPNVKTVLSALLQQQSPENMLFLANDSFSNFVMDWFLVDLASYIEDEPDKANEIVDFHALLGAVWGRQMVEGSFTYSAIKSRNIIKRYLDDIVKLMDVGGPLYNLDGTTLQDAMVEPELVLVKLMVGVVACITTDVRTHTTPVELSKLIVERLEKKHD